MSDLPASFAEMNLSRQIVRALNDMNIAAPTMIQAKTIPFGLLGKDVVVCACTGSGKTLAYMLPIIERLVYKPKSAATRVLVLVPTRELAVQAHSVATGLSKYTTITSCLVIGGTDLRAQEASVRKRPDIVVATPGRVLDLLANVAGFSLESLDILVIDEADRILDDGFKVELDSIIKQTPKNRQTLLISATISESVDDLVRLSLVNPIQVKDIETNRLVQEFVRIRDSGSKLVFLHALLTRVCCKGRVIVFFENKRNVKFATCLFKRLGLNVAQIHGDLPQSARVNALESFRRGECMYLFATNVAARGIDIDAVNAVVNCDMPKTIEQYIHRVGRTARAGKTGLSISLVAEKDRAMMKAILAKSLSETARRRTIKPSAIMASAALVDANKADASADLEVETQHAMLDKAETMLKRTENLIKHRNEIMTRPKRKKHV